MSLTLSVEDNNNICARHFSSFVLSPLPPAFGPRPKEGALYLDSPQPVIFESLVTFTDNIMGVSFDMKKVLCGIAKAFFFFFGKNQHRSSLRRDV